MTMKRKGKKVGDDFDLYETEKRIPENFWEMEAKFLARSVAEHQSLNGCHSQEQLRNTLLALTPDNVLENLSGKARSRFAGMGPISLLSVLATLRSLVATSASR